MTVFAFDRDWTVDVNPHPTRQAVPLDWVRTLAHETAHPVYAIGNQDLADEAAVPGVVDIVGKHPDDWGTWLGDKRPDGRYEQFPQRRERLALIAELHPEASDYVVVDDLDLSDVDGWDHYHAWEFVPAVKRGDIHPALPWVGEPLSDGGRATGRHSDVAAPHVAGLAEAMTVGDVPTRLDAGATSARVAEDAPERVVAVADELMTALDDHEAGRRNACRALGQLAAALPDDAGSTGETVAGDSPRNPDRATVAAALEDRQQADEAVAVSRAAEQALGRIRSVEDPR